MHKIPDTLHVEDDEILANRVGDAGELADHVPEVPRSCSAALT